PEKCRHLGGLDRVNGRTHERLIDGPQVRLLSEDDIRRILDLGQVPLVRQAKLLNDRAEQLRIAVEFVVKKTRIGLVRKLLSGLPIGNVRESVVEHPVVYPCFTELRGQQVVSVKVGLQVKRAPRRNAQEAQPQIFIDEVEVVVQALGAVWPEGGTTGLLII